MCKNDLLQCVFLIKILCFWALFDEKEGKNNVFWVFLRPKMGVFATFC